MRRRLPTANRARWCLKRFHERVQTAMKLKPGSGTGFPENTSAKAATGQARSRSRACSASTTHSGPVRDARDFGNTVDFDLNLVIPDKELSLNGGAIDPWNRPKYRSWFTDLRKQAGELGIPMDVPWREMPEAAREIVLRGKGGFAGVFGFFAQMERKKYKLHVRVMLSKYRGYAECPDCRGQRLRAEARSVRIATQKHGGKTFARRRR